MQGNAEMNTTEQSLEAESLAQESAQIEENTIANQETLNQEPLPETPQTINEYGLEEHPAKLISHHLIVADDYPFTFRITDRRKNTKLLSACQACLTIQQKASLQRSTLPFEVYYRKF